MLLHNLVRPYPVGLQLPAGEGLQVQIPGAEHHIITCHNGNGSSVFVSLPFLDLLSMLDG